MSGVFQAHDVAKRALRKTNRYSINDSAPDAESLSEALYWLDMIVAFTVAVNPLPWLWPAEKTLDLVADKASYDFNTEIGEISGRGPDFAIAARRIDSGGFETPIDIISRDTFNSLRDPDQSGPPDSIYINRLENLPQVFVHPIPDDTEYDIKITVQVFAPDLTDAKTNTETGLAQGFAFWAVTRLASEIGDGPIVKLNDNTVRRWKGEADHYLNQLLANHAARENTDEIRTLYRNL